MYILPLVSLFAVALAFPQRRKGNGGGAQRATAQQQAAQIPGGISKATDGSTIVDDTVNVNGLPIRFKVSAPADQFLTTTGVTGAAATSPNGTMGVNVLLHGDGGQSFFDFPNQAVQANTMGVALLAPDPNLFWGGGSGLQRTDGVAHAQAVNDFVQQMLPQMVAFDNSKVFFTGVSGGSLLMSGFFIPAQMQNFANSGVMLNCGGMPPQVNVVDPAAVANTTIHFQSTQSELKLLQGSIPQAVTAYEQIASQQGLNTDQINALQTVDNSPTGGHCEFDGKDFVSGVQVMANAYSNVIQAGGDGNVQGLGAPSNGQVKTGVVGNEQLKFVGGQKRWVVPSDKRWVVPNDKWVVPSDKWVVPNDKWVVPNDKWVVPNDKWVVPSDKWVVTEDP
ncbi:uncharacterized protein BDR25DRAFT_396312 [Lindgomyces ingoldianus]|uniref:Uncharacterized protein n=1 Tax=Lindgomyces ingoldianus TaxID=673940 RepID=A0ACB6QFQ1_9PLEO|nr:uncharacterized protein BDR25DRAFT_396312 [Lindgomyces ingoldianus]KAF2465325.1 hypothetical protein BDR25DRAFT_396312 [Lindgomyces ingoldianus]